MEGGIPSVSRSCVSGMLFLQNPSPYQTLQQRQEAERPRAKRFVYGWVDDVSLPGVCPHAQAEDAFLGKSVLDGAGGVLAGHLICRFNDEQSPA